ncbi:MAG: sulfite exporter TauE/SafE family protein [Coxiellaceae bacterium]|nr:sulfite exporter TauE/SafE family protein [Coxiellaceae bacterium]
MDIFIILLIVAGFAASFLSGMLGLGGSIILLPTLLLAFTHGGYAPSNDLIHLAINTSLTIVFLNSIGNVWEQCRNQRVNWQLSYYLLPGVLVGILFGAALGLSINPAYISIIAGAFLITLSLSLLYQRRGRAVGAQPVSRLKMILGGIVVGAPSSLLGIGGGSMMIPVLHHMGVDMKKIVGTTAIFTCITTLAALLTTLVITLYKGDSSMSFFHLIEWHVVVIMLPIMYVGVRLGSRCFNHIPKGLLRGIFTAVLLIMGGFLIFN